MPTEKITIKTSDGNCPAYLATPAGQGRWPALIFYGDAGGIRPAVVDMAQRLANLGYAVLLPDLFYRFGPYEPLVPAEVFKGDFRVILGPMMATTGNREAAKDTEAFISYLDSCGAVKGDKMGAVGFCMGGGMAITAAATYPDRFAAVASFHGGNLATDKPASPHLLASNVNAEVYIAAADNDASYPPAMAELIESTLTQAHVKYSAETYTGAAHGWMVTDFPVFDRASAERGWTAMAELFRRNLPA